MTFVPKKEVQIFIDSVFIIANVEKGALLSMIAMDKEYMLIFSSHDKAKAYWNGSNMFSEATIIEIKDNILSLVQTMTKIGPIAYDAVREEGSLKSFQEILYASPMPKAIGQA